ncbi:carbohydrate-binding protein, partial [Streptomyces beijiangensis]
TPTATASPSPTATVTPPAGCTAAAWNSTVAYTGGAQVSYGGHTWKAQWWTQGEIPGTTGQWGVWTDLGAC